MLLATASIIIDDTWGLFRFEPEIDTIPNLEKNADNRETKDGN